MSFWRNVQFLNPFYGLIETKKYPHARAHRTSFLKKLDDTFSVFSGTLFSSVGSEKFHMGIFDYLTLGFHFAIGELIDYFYEKAEVQSLPLYIIYVIAIFIFNFPRMLFAGVMTLICLPFVGIAHAFSKAIGGENREKILSYVMPSEYRLYLTPLVLPADLNPYKNSD